MVVLVTAVLILSSFIFTIEPYFDIPNMESKSFVFEKDMTYLIENIDGGYDLYFNNEYFSTVPKIDDVFFDVKIYTNLEDALK